MAESFSFTDDEIQLFLEVCIEYKTKREYCGVGDWNRLEINIDKQKKNLFSNILKIQLLVFRIVKTGNRL